MSLFIKKLFNLAIFNSCLFLLLFIGIQNSSNKSKVDFYNRRDYKNYQLSFIVGSSFILGSILGCFIDFNIKNK